MEFTFNLTIDDFEAAIKTAVGEAYRSSDKSTKHAYSWFQIKFFVVVIAICFAALTLFEFRKGIEAGVSFFLGIVAPGLISIGLFRALYRRLVYGSRSKNEKLFRSSGLDRLRTIRIDEQGLFTSEAGAVHFHPWKEFERIDSFQGNVMFFERREANTSVPIPVEIPRFVFDSPEEAERVVEFARKLKLAADAHPLEVLPARVLPLPSDGHESEILESKLGTNEIEAMITALRTRHPPSVYERRLWCFLTTGGLVLLAFVALPAIIWPDVFPQVKSMRLWFFPWLLFVFYAWIHWKIATLRDASVPQQQSISRRFQFSPVGWWCQTDRAESQFSWAVYQELEDVQSGLILVEQGAMRTAIIPRSAFRDDAEYEETVSRILEWHAAATQVATVA